MLRIDPYPSCHTYPFSLSLHRIPNAIGDQIQKACGSIFPLRDTMIRKVKMLKKPKFDIIKLMEMHADNGEDVGAKVAAIAEEVKTEGAGGRY
mgnify:CR=1 FL=1